MLETEIAAVDPAEAGAAGAARGRSRGAANARRVFGNRDIRRLTISNLALTFGGSCYQIALVVYALRSGGSGAVGVALAVQVLPVAAVAPLGSVLADRFPRRRLMVVVDALRCTCTGAVAVSVMSDAPLVVVLALGAPGALASSTYGAAARALLPSLARDPEELTAANVAFTGIDHAGLLVGPAVVGVLLAVAAPGWVFAAGSVMFAISGVLVSGVRGGGGRPSGAEAWGSFRVEVLAGIRTVAGGRDLRLLVGVYSLLAFAGGGLQVLVVLVSHQFAGLGDAGVGTLYSAVGVGGLLGTFAATGLTGRRALSELLAVGVGLWGVAFVVIGAAPALLTALFGMGVLGVANVLSDVSVVTLLQRLVREEVLGRVFGVLVSVLMGMCGIGALLTPLLVRAIGLRGVLLVAGGALPVLVAIVWGRLRALDAPSESLPERRGLLAGLELFASLPVPTRESLACSLAEVSVADGQAIITQGERGDEFYIVAEGTVEVLIDGIHRRFQGHGEGFGEIALLRDVPRTATVVACGPVRLFTLAREPFISAVAGHPASEAVASVLITTRLGPARPQSAVIAAVRADGS